jgi:hypothetical protein
LEVGGLCGGRGSEKENENENGNGSEKERKRKVRERTFYPEVSGLRDRKFDKRILWALRPALRQAQGPVAERSM